MERITRSTVPLHWWEQVGVDFAGSWSTVEASSEARETKEEGIEGEQDMADYVVTHYHLNYRS